MLSMVAQFAKIAYNQNIMQKTPSEHFASGAVFDITRQNHDQFARIVNSNDAMSLILPSSQI